MLLSTIHSKQVEESSGESSWRLLDIPGLSLTLRDFKQEIWRWFYVVFQLFRSEFFATRAKKFFRPPLKHND